MKRKCKCCHEDEARWDELCNACSVYKHRNGYLPNAKVLSKRLRQRRKRHEHVVAVLTDVPEFMALLRDLYGVERKGAA